MRDLPFRGSKLAEDSLVAEPASKSPPSAFGKSPIPAASLRKGTRGDRFGFYLCGMLKMFAGPDTGDGASWPP